MSNATTRLVIKVALDGEDPKDYSVIPADKPAVDTEVKLQVALKRPDGTYGVRGTFFKARITNISKIDGTVYIAERTDKK